MNKRVISFFLVLVLLAGLLPAGFASAAEASGKEYGNYIPGSHIVRSAASVSVMLTGTKRDIKDPDAWKKEIRVFSFDPQTGLFEAGEGREPGDEIRWSKWLEDGCGYSLQLLQPGKYLLSGIPFYVLDPSVACHTALLEELDAAQDKADAKTQLTKGTNLYKWLQKRVKAKVPEETAEICRDPVNALLTGFAAPEAYPQLLRLVMSTAGIRTVLVDGKRVAKKEETDWTWAACELDGKWLWADPALDAGKTAYFAKDDAAMQKDHILSEEAEHFVRNHIRSNYADVLLRDDRDLEARLKIANHNEGYFHDVLFIDGPLYSVGPSEPVTMHFYRNWDDSEDKPDKSGAGWKQDVVLTYFSQRLDWNTQFKYYYDPLPKNEKDYFRSQEITEGKDVEILEYDPDTNTVVAKFKTPGLYKFYFEGDYFCVLDPEDPEQAEMARMLDEARSIRGSTDRETAKLLQDWEASKIKYDYNAFKLMKIWSLGLDDPQEGDEYTDEIGMQEASAQDAFGGLISGCSVCGGYANLYTLLLRNAGIPAFQVGGYLKAKKMGHAWNILRIDDVWLYADPTWDDKGRTSGTRYFLLTYEQYIKHHDEFGGPETSVRDMFETCVYELMCHRFDLRYAVKLDLPELLRALPGDISGYQFPEKDPSFIRPVFEVDDDHISCSFGKARVNTAVSYHNMKGEQYQAFDLDEEALRPSGWEETFWRFAKGKIMDLVVTDYVGPYKPTNKPFITQEYIWARTVLEKAEYSYSVPLKRGEIRGYSEKSSRTWTYDMEMHKKAASWELEKDGTTLTVTAYFDENGKTVSASVLLKPPAGGNGIGWETTKDGHVTSLRIDAGNDTYLLAEMTDTWQQNRYEMYRRKVLTKYPSIQENGPLPEGVHLYRLSGDLLVSAESTAFLFRPNLYSGEAIATKDELLCWDEDGRLQVNPDARDLNGDPVSIKMGEAMDLSMATRLLISD